MIDDIRKKSLHQAYGDSSLVRIIVESEYGHVVYNSVLTNIHAEVQLRFDTTKWSKGVHQLKLLNNDNVIFQTLIYKNINQRILHITIPIETK